MTAARSVAIPEAVAARVVEVELGEDDPGAATAGTRMIAAPAVATEAVGPRTVARAVSDVVSRTTDARVVGSGAADRMTVDQVASGGTRTIVDRAADTAAGMTILTVVTHVTAGMAARVVGMTEGTVEAASATDHDPVVTAAGAGGRTAAATAKGALSGAGTTIGAPTDVMIATDRTGARVAGNGMTVGATPGEATTVVAASVGTTTVVGDARAASEVTGAAMIASATGAAIPGSEMTAPEMTVATMIAENHEVASRGAAVVGTMAAVAMTAGVASGRTGEVPIVPATTAPGRIDMAATAGTVSRAAGSAAAVTATIVHRMTGRCGVPTANAIPSFPTAWTCGSCLEA